MSETKLSGVSYAKAFAIILVILGHAFSRYQEIGGEFSSVTATFVRFIYAVHVPLFFAVAGFLCHSQHIGHYYWKKVCRLLVPFVTFSLLKIFYSNVISSDFAHGNSLASQIMDAFLYGRLYWFIYCMFVVYLISPILWIHKSVAWILIPVLILVNTLNERYHFWRSDDFTPFQIGKVSVYLVYFASGYAVRNFIKDFPPAKKLRPMIFASVGFALGVVLFILTLLGKFPQDYLCSLVLTYTLMLFLVGTALLLPQGKAILEKFATYSLQCMFLDSFYKAILFTLATHFFRLNLSMVFFLAALDCTLSLATSILLDKLPKSLKFAVGL